MATYSELMAQAQSLLAQAEQARRDERAAAIAEVRAKMKEFGITTADLGGSSGGKRSGKSKSNAAPKYRGPTGELWAGGPGRKPEWVRGVLAAGKSLEEFRI